VQWSGRCKRARGRSPSNRVNGVITILSALNFKFPIDWRRPRHCLTPLTGLHSDTHEWSAIGLSHLLDGLPRVRLICSVAPAKADARHPNFSIISRLSRPCTARPIPRLIDSGKPGKIRKARRAASKRGGRLSPFNHQVAAALLSPDLSSIFISITIRRADRCLPDNTYLRTYLRTRLPTCLRTCPYVRVSTYATTYVRM
jgi:hypothetical protein